MKHTSIISKLSSAADELHKSEDFSNVLAMGALASCAYVFGKISHEPRISEFGAYFSLCAGVLDAGKLCNHYVNLGYREDTQR